jgi:hypothetical protein
VDDVRNAPLARGGEQQLGAVMVHALEVGGVRRPQVRDGGEVIHRVHAVQRAPHVLRVEDRPFHEFRQRPGWRRLQVQHPDDVAPAAKRRHEVLSDESASTGDQDAAMVRRAGRFLARLQGDGFHVPLHKVPPPVISR